MPKLKKPTRPFQRIAFFGPMCSGKTWAAEYLRDNYGYKKVAFAEKLKGLAYDLYGISGKSGPNREILQHLGTDLRKYDPDIWIKHALYRAQQFESESLVIDDLRYPNEAIVLKKNGFALVGILCDEEKRQERIRTLYPDYSLSVHNHPSETGWEFMKADTTIKSDGYNTMADLDELLESVFEGAT
jgi:hypothetical protein